MIHPIYRDFLDISDHSGAWDDLVQGYLAPNQAFLSAYVASVSQGGKGWNACMDEYHGQWYDVPETVKTLLHRLDRIDGEARAQQGYEVATRVLELTCDGRYISVHRSHHGRLLCG